MRIRIDGPCFIESEQPFIITPIYVSEKSETPTPPTSEVDTPTRKRKTRKKVNVTCKQCRRTFRGHANSLYCNAQCKQAFYRAQSSL